MIIYEYVNCDLCGIDNTEILYNVEECTGMYHHTFNLVQCKNCGLVYTNPRPPRGEIAKYYPQETYYAYQDKFNKKDILKNKIKYFLIEIAGGYRERKINKLIQIIVTRIANKLLLCIVPKIDNGKILDVGCGNGEFLLWFKHKGWDVYGVEINEKAANLIRGFISR